MNGFSKCKLTNHPQACGVDDAFSVDYALRLRLCEQCYKSKYVSWHSYANSPSLTPFALVALSKAPRSSSHCRRTLGKSWETSFACWFRPRIHAVSIQQDRFFPPLKLVPLSRFKTSQIPANHSVGCSHYRTSYNTPTSSRNSKRS